MKKNYFTIALFCSFLLLGGIFLHASLQLEQQEEATSPFTETLIIQGSLQGGKTEKKGLDNAGHFLVTFPDTEGLWAPSKKTLEAGRLFISGRGIGAEYAMPNEIRPSPSFPYKMTQGGEIVVAELLIRFGRGSVFVDRDPKTRLTRIYALDQEVDVYFSGTETPFVVPPGMRITVFDGQINEKTPELYYSKLRKKNEFNLETFQGPEENRPHVIEALASIKTAQQLALSWRRELEDYQEAQFQRWKGPSSIVVFIQKWQQRLDFFTLPKRKAHFAMVDFARNHNTPQDLAAQNPGETLLGLSNNLNRSWEAFKKAERVVRPVPLSTESSRDERAFGNMFFHFQEALSERDYQGALNHLQSLATNWNPQDFETLDPSLLTRYRRLMGELVQHRTFIKEDYTAYVLFSQLAVAEIAAYDQAPEQREMILEVAQQTLDFLFYQVQIPKPSEDILAQLQELYQNLKIGTIVGQNVSGQIFDPQHLEMIRLLGQHQNKSLSVESVKAFVVEDDDEVAFVRDQLEKEQEKSPETALPEYDFKAIRSTRDLRSFFVVLGANVSELNFPQNKDPNYLSFENLYFGNHLIKGGFHIEGQFFEATQIGSQNFERLSMDEFSKAIYQAKQFGVNASNRNSGIVPQNTARARLERLLLQQKIKNEGLEIDFDQITILDETAKTFSVQGVRSGDQYTADFIYKKNNQSVEKVYLQFRGNTRHFKEPIPFRELKDRLDEASTVNLGAP